VTLYTRGLRPRGVWHKLLPCQEGVWIIILQRKLLASAGGGRRERMNIFILELKS